MVRPQAEPADKAVEPAVAERGPVHAPFALALNQDFLWSRDAGLALFSESQMLLRLGASASYDVLALPPGLVVAAELGWGLAQDDRSNTLGGTLSSAHFLQHSIQASGVLRYQLLSFLEPMVRLSGGVHYVEMDLAPSQSPDQLDSVTGWHPFAGLGGGVLLRTPDRFLQTEGGHMATTSAGLLIEGGYSLASAASFDLHYSQRPEARTVIPVTTAAPGSVSLSAAYLRLALRLRF